MKVPGCSVAWRSAGSTFDPGVGRTERTTGSKAAAGVAAAVLAALLLLAPDAAAQLQISSPDDSVTIKLGLLAQGRYEALDDAEGDDTAQNLFFRRLRLLAGGKLGERWSFFLETDSPNLAKGTADGGKATPDIFIQDFVVTYTHSDALHLDGGMLLLALSHQSNQGAVTLLGTDYGPYSFLWSGPTDSRVGRDYGLRLRGYVLDDHLEYRAGVFQGVRGEEADNPFRFVGRLVWNVFEPEKGLFYNGTHLGKKQVLSFGASVDNQDDYEAFTADLFWDQPLAQGNAVTVQVDWSTYDGGGFLPLPEQDASFLEAGFYHGRTKLLPYVQWSSRDFDDPFRADEEQLQLGVGWMFAEHNRNVKLSWTRIERDGAADRDQLWLQAQVFTF